MNILLIAATEAEIAPLTEYIEPFRTSANGQKYAFGNAYMSLLITGVGMVATAYNLTKELAKDHYDMVLQAGVGGAFSSSVALGDVVLVGRERFADLGAEDNGNYIDIFDLGLQQTNEKPFADGWLEAPATKWFAKFGMKTVNGVTVNTVSGSLATIGRIVDSYNPDVESMEGAAMHYVCLQEGRQFVQIRAISNYVEPRDKSKWQMGKAIKSLNDVLKAFADSLKEA